MNTAIRTLILAGAMTALTSCDMLWLDTHWRSGDYVLIAVDTPGQMMLATDEHNGTASTLVRPTVFSVGADDRYIVLKQHPATDGLGGFDRSVTRYFIVTRSARAEPASEETGIRGPLSNAEFDEQSVTLKLPPFSKTFDDLT